MRTAILTRLFLVICLVGSLQSASGQDSPFDGPGAGPAPVLPGDMSFTAFETPITQVASVAPATEAHNARSAAIDERLARIDGLLVQLKEKLGSTATLSSSHQTEAPETVAEAATDQLKDEVIRAKATAASAISTETEALFDQLVELLDRIETNQTYLQATERRATWSEELREQRRAVRENLTQAVTRAEELRVRLLPFVRVLRGGAALQSAEDEMASLTAFQTYLARLPDHDPRKAELKRKLARRNALARQLESVDEFLVREELRTLQLRNLESPSPATEQLIEEKRSTLSKLARLGKMTRELQAEVSPAKPGSARPAPTEAVPEPVDTSSESAG